MHRVAVELDRRLSELDRATAEHVERLVRDALALAQQKAVSSQPWPDGYFDRTAGALANEPLDRPEQGELPTREAW